MNKKQESYFKSLTDKAEQYMREHPNIRFGQAIYNVAYDMFPDEVEDICNTEFDCFYHDDLVDKFLGRLQYLINLNAEKPLKDDDEKEEVQRYLDSLIKNPPEELGDKI